MSSKQSMYNPEWDNEAVVAMYDVRGIQNYIYRTSKVKDARGASAIVNDIIGDALRYAIEGESISSDLVWRTDEGIKRFNSEDEFKDIQVLFIGGGNATVLYKKGSTCIAVNKKMSKYVLEHTYSLQLGISITRKTDNYSDDYKELQQKMIKTKALMTDTKPLGALPVVEIELKTGYPVEKQINDNGIMTKVSQETYLKKNKTKQLNNDRTERRFEKYITKKGRDSNIAVIHIDGNNMALRIRGLIENETDYITAVNKMRQISYNIDNSFQKVFNMMAAKYNGDEVNIKEKEDNNFVLKILVAGDDITYVCNARIALETVKYYCQNIASCTMNKDINDMSTQESVEKYGFSVCAGIAFCNSHFPFSSAYNVAEECCESAKEYAKKHNDDERIGNYLDFQICKNIQTENLSRTRNKEYITSTGENLCIRPYYIEIDSNVYKEFNVDKYRKYSDLVNNINYFNSDSIPRSFAKQIRNEYSGGEDIIKVLIDFLKSRGHKMPDKTYEMYIVKDYTKIAKWYDALELMDYYEEV